MLRRNTKYYSCNNAKGRGVWAPAQQEERVTKPTLKTSHYLFCHGLDFGNFPVERLFFSSWPVPPVMLLIGYINLVCNEWEMLRCCQPQSSPLFTNSLRSIDAGQRGENDNINQSWRHNDPNQPEITGNVTMNYVSVAAAAGSPRLSAGCAALRVGPSDCHYLLWYLPSRLEGPSRRCKDFIQVFPTRCPSSSPPITRRTSFSSPRSINTVHSEVACTSLLCSR